MSQRSPRWSALPGISRTASSETRARRYRADHRGASRKMALGRKSEMEDEPSESLLCLPCGRGKCQSLITFIYLICLGRLGAEEIKASTAIQEFFAQTGKNFVAP